MPGPLDKASLGLAQLIDHSVHSLGNVLVRELSQIELEGFLIEGTSRFFKSTRQAICLSVEPIGGIEMAVFIPKV